MANEKKNKKNTKNVKKEQTKKEPKKVIKKEDNKKVKVEKEEVKKENSKMKVNFIKKDKIKKGSGKAKLDIKGSSDFEVYKIIKYLIIVVVVFGLIYFLTVYITTHGTDSDFKKVVEEATVQHEKILAGSTFSQSDKEYYVLFYNTKEDYTYTNVYSTYKEKEGHLPIYYVDTKEGLNRNYISEEDEKRDPKDVSELKVKGVTLIKIKDKKVTEYITDEDKIEEKLS